MIKPLLQLTLTLALAGAALSSQAHVALPPGGAAAGSTYSAAFKVGHACKGAQSTTALVVRLPAGFTLVRAEPRAGWKLEQRGDQVRWTAESAATALPGTRPDQFVVVGKLVDKAGTLWFPTTQTCDVGAADWAEMPDAARPTPEYPAPHLEVLAPGVAAVDARDAWARATVQGQTTSAVYLKLTAPMGARLVGATSALASVSLHEMSMTGDVMRMREVPGLDLPPGQPVALAPNGAHLMLTGLKQQLAAGGAGVPMVLHFVDRDGRKGDLPVQVPVGNAPAGADEHRHPHP